MSEFLRVTSAADLRTLDESEILLGYMEGFEGSPQPCSGTSRSFYHGWRNGMVDAGFADADDAQVELAAELRHQPPISVH
jgi:hypothetical protein